jgi:hypothetical protein
MCARLNSLFNHARSINRRKKLTAWIILEGELLEISLVKPHNEMGDMLLFHVVDGTCTNSMRCEHWVPAPAWVPMMLNLYN